VYGIKYANITARQLSVVKLSAYFGQSCVRTSVTCAQPAWTTLEIVQFCNHEVYFLFFNSVLGAKTVSARLHQYRLTNLITTNLRREIIDNYCFYRSRSPRKTGYHSFLFNGRPVPNSLSHIYRFKDLRQGDNNFRLQIL
jgi:hypothetical protein